METAQMIQQFISNCGFPIAAFCLMFWLNTKQNKSLDELAAKIAALIELLHNSTNC